MYQSKKPYLYGTGRRKSSVARVHLFPNGTGSITINDRDIDDYFGLDTLKMVVRQPLELTGNTGKMDIVATVTESDGVAHIYTFCLCHGDEPFAFVSIAMGNVGKLRMPSARHTMGHLGHEQRLMVGIKECRQLIDRFFHSHVKGRIVVDIGHRKVVFKDTCNTLFAIEWHHA